MAILVCRLGLPLGNSKSQSYCLYCDYSNHVNGWCRTEELARLVYETMRETYRAVPFPDQLARLLAQPREFLIKYVSPSPPLHTLLFLKFLLPGG